MTPDPPVPPGNTVLDVRDLMLGFRISQALSVAAALSVSDHLADGPLDIATLAARTHSDPGSLRRLMRALAALDMYDERADDSFALTDRGAVLDSRHPAGLRDAAINVGRAYFWESWGGLEHSVRTGENAFHHQHGENVWQYREHATDDGDIFDRAMTSHTRLVAHQVAAAYNFTAFESVVDVGGGQGLLISAVLAAAPQARGVLVDRPLVIATAPEVLEGEGVADRCETVGGSFFDAVPAGHDAYLLKSVLHDWEDEECRQILRVCRAAMTEPARLLVIEQLVGPPNTGLRTKLSDLNMLVLPGGRERTEDEFDRLFADAGLRRTTTVPTASDFFIMEVVSD